LIYKLIEPVLRAGLPKAPVPPGVINRDKSNMLPMLEALTSNSPFSPSPLGEGLRVR